MLELTITRGDDRSYDLLIRDGTNALVNLTGATIKWEAKKRWVDALPIIEKAVGTGITIDPDQVINKGKAVLALVPADTSSLGNWNQRLRWDLQVTVSGKIRTVEKGTLLVEVEVTQ